MKNIKILRNRKVADLCSVQCLYVFIRQEFIEDEGSVGYLLHMFTVRIKILLL